MRVKQCRRNWKSVLVVLLPVVLLAPSSRAVTSKVTRQGSPKELLAGKTEGVVVTSQGAIQLGRAAKVLATESDDVWSINRIVVSGGTIFLGTSPNGNVYKYSLGKLTKIWPTEEEAAAQKAAAQGQSQKPAGAEPNEAKGSADNVVKAKERFANQHIFAMATDVAGRLLVGISGKTCKVCRYETGKMETIFEPNDARYIFDIETDNVGNIYLGTGPEGKVYVLDPSGKVAQMVYDSPDKNILSVAPSRDGFVYAGSDTRGLIYKINPRNKTATVLYDSDEPEISALLTVDGMPGEPGVLYAAATSAKVVETEDRFAAQQAASGRPEPKEGSGKSVSGGEDGIKLKIANSSPAAEEKPAARPRPAPRPPKPGTASYVYRIDKQGYVTEVFSEMAVFLCMANQNGKILVGSGNDARLYLVDPDDERQVVAYEDEKAAQITAVTVSEQDVYIGTANPARLVLLAPTYASAGTYISDLIDAEQPARWGKLQIDADIPRACKVLVSSRSGNVKDVNDPTFSDWTEPVPVTEPVQLRCPIGRFCQYKLILETSDGQKTPLIREVAVASTVPNLAPKVDSVDVSRLTAPGKEGLFKISYKAGDTNEDKLTYTLYFRKIGRSNWIEMKDKLEAENYEWDSKTVEDGRYEIRVVASDEKGNSPETKLTGSRISDPVVVDNTGPVVRKYAIEKNGKSATLKLEINDELSVISKLEYTIDSNAEWKGTLPDDFVCDTTDESFTITTGDLEPGEHVIALKVLDDVGNATYKTFELNVPAR
jgi:outer membrane protein assembly factor BamB